MARRIKIVAEAVGEEHALLTDESPDTAQAIWDSLPVEGRANTWGDEIYFSIPVDVEAENGRAVVDLGEIGYWPPGRAFCIFFGPTPASRGEEIRAASAVNVIGKLEGDPKVFLKVKDGDRVRLERA